MRLTTKYDPSQNAGVLPVSFETSEEPDDTFHIVLSPMEWKEVHALAHFAQSGLAYDCEAPYVTQVFEYHLSQPEDMQSNKDMQAASSAIVRMAETIPADGRNGGDVTLGLPKEEMRQLLIILNMAASAEEQADLLYNAARGAFPYPFPDLTVSSCDYARAFGDLLAALHHDTSLVIDLKARDNAAPRLDEKKLPPELRTYLEGTIRNLIAQNPEIYAGDTRTIEIQTNELIDKVNSESLRQYRAETPPSNPESAPSYRPGNPFDYSELIARVEERGGTISAELTADRLRSQLSAGQWSQITHIDPGLIKVEAERQRRALTPSLRRYNLERRLARALLTDERTRPYLRAQ